MLTPEQAKNIKEQIIKQIESTFPEDKQESAIEYISALNEEQLEEFLKKNKMVRDGEGGEANGESESKENSCIYCLISQKKVESVQIYEDNDCLGVLEINPLSKGHAILIPKKHIKDVKELSKEALILAEKIGKKISKSLKAKSIQITPSHELGHAIINIIPIYENQPLKREKAKPEELKAIAEKIGKIAQAKSKSEKEKSSSEEKAKTEEKKAPEIIKLPRRIP